MDCIYIKDRLIMTYISLFELLFTYKLPTNVCNPLRLKSLFVSSYWQHLLTPFLPDRLIHIIWEKLLFLDCRLETYDNDYFMTIQATGLNWTYQMQCFENFALTCWPLSGITLVCQFKPFPRPVNRPYIIRVITFAEWMFFQCLPINFAGTLQTVLHVLSLSNQITKQITTVWMQ